MVPRTCKLNVTQNRIADIYKELRTLRLDDAPNAIAVLLRVFLELSIDYFLTKEGGTLRVTRRALEVGSCGNHSTRSSQRWSRFCGDRRAPSRLRRHHP